MVDFEKEEVNALPSEHLRIDNKALSQNQCSQLYEKTFIILDSFRFSTKQKNSREMIVEVLIPQTKNYSIFPFANFDTNVTGHITYSKRLGMPSRLLFMKFKNFL